MIRENEIKDAIQSYVNGESLDEFELWLADHSWNMHRDSEPDVQRLVGRIQMLIAEHGYGNVSEADLRRFLSDIVDEYSVSVAIDAPPRRSPIFSSGSRTLWLKQLQAVSG